MTLSCITKGASSPKKIETGGNHAERVDCFGRWSSERVIRKTSSFTKDVRCVLDDFFVFFGRAVRAARFF